jgi:hypothetical protein
VLDPNVQTGNTIFDKLIMLLELIIFKLEDHTPMLLENKTPLLKEFKLQKVIFELA